MVDRGRTGVVTRDRAGHVSSCTATAGASSPATGSGSSSRQDDAHFLKTSEVPSTITINGVQLRIPVREPQPPRARGLQERVQVLQGRAGLPRRRGVPPEVRHQPATVPTRFVQVRLAAEPLTRLAAKIRPCSHERGGGLMATVEAPEKLGIRPFDEFDGVFDVWPRGERLDAIREAARPVPRALRDAGQPRARGQDGRPGVGRLPGVVRASTARPRALNPYINIVNRLVIVQFEDFEGNLQTLAWEPTIAEGAAEAPFYDQLLKRYGEFLSYKVFATFYNTVEEAIAEVRPHAGRHRLRQLRPPARAGPAPDHGHDAAGATASPSRARRSSRTRSSCSSARRSTRSSPPHPMQWAWYVPGGMDDVIEDNLVLLDGDVELGKGVAIVRDAGPHRRQPQPRGQHRRRRLGHLRERRLRRLVAPAPVEDPGDPQVRRVLQPRGGDELEHARGLDRPVRLDGEGEGDRRPEPRATRAG